MKQINWTGVASVIIAIIFMLTAIHLGQVYANARQADFIETQVAQKVIWMQNINDAIMEMRTADLRSSWNCQSVNHLTANNSLRSDARIKLITTSAGVSTIFDTNTLNDIRAYLQYDKGIDDVCDKSKYDDKKSWEYFGTINKDFNASITADKAEIARLHGVTAS